MACSEPCTAACGRLVWLAETDMKAYAMSFDGALLGRGFWLYVWRITDDSRSALYVGRTGDSSSPHASSPFKRIRPWGSAGHGGQVFIIHYALGRPTV
jgi:hypothetical protein